VKNKKEVAMRKALVAVLSFVFVGLGWGQSYNLNKVRGFYNNDNFPPGFPEDYIPSAAVQRYILTTITPASDIPLPEGSLSKVAMRVQMFSPATGYAAVVRVEPASGKISAGGGMSLDVNFRVNNPDPNAPSAGSVFLLLENSGRFRGFRAQAISYDSLNQFKWQRFVFTEWLNVWWADSSIIEGEAVYIFFGPAWAGSVSDFQYNFDNLLARKDANSPWILVNNLGEDAQAIVNVEKTNNQLPEGFALSQNYPNPFNPSTIIRFALPERAFVELKVFNVLGQEITVLARGEFEAGNYQVYFDAASLPSGTYFYRLRAGKIVLTQKMVLSK